MFVRNESCYLCGSRALSQRKGRCRDNAELVPLECNNCGLVFLNSFSHISETYYADSHMHDSKPCDVPVMSAVGLNDAGRRYRMLAHEIVGKSVLDIGSGDGQFLALAKTTARSVTGVEPDRQWQGRYAQQGIPVLPHLPESGNAFDCITMFHVLEHIPDPLPFLKNINKIAMLQDGGGGTHCRSPQCR